MNTSKNKIAIIGYSYKLPGEAHNDETLWSLLNKKTHVYSDVCDAGRWDRKYHYTPKNDDSSSSKIYASKAGLIKDIKLFDNHFFDISAVEASYLDPQQRILLETSWHALEHANINPKNLKDSNTGVFVGVTSDDYSRLHTKSDIPITAYTGIGSAKSIAAGRLAYFYDLKGPVLQLDTTCSSSLVGMHLAIESLERKSCDLAFVGGVNAILSPETTIGFCEMKALSRLGKLAAFDDSADGYIRGEGGGIFILKRLEDAKRDGNQIHAVILGSAIKHDGKTNGLTAPNPKSQIAVIQDAIKKAQIGINDFDYIEAHGTGTKLGDLIEANSLGEIFSAKDTKLEIGSIKANIGHLEAAAGVASLAKAILLLKKRKIPGQVNLLQKSNKIDWEKLNLNISNEVRSLDSNINKSLKIGVSAFGMSGTNAHIILEEYPTNKVNEEFQSFTYTHPFFLVSAKENVSLIRNTKNFKQVVTQNINNQSKINSLGRLTQLGRTHFKKNRSAFYINDQKEIVEFFPEKKPANNRQEIVFAFTGQEDNSIQLSNDLYQKSEVFREYFDRCSVVFEEETGSSLHEVLNNKELLSYNCNIQSVLVAIQICLAKFWESIGVIPTTVVGHSTGEYAAAVISGHISLEEAMSLIILRGKSIAKNSKNGIMISIVSTKDKIDSFLTNLPRIISVAAYNSSFNVTISLDLKDKEECISYLEKCELEYNLLDADYAFHSKILSNASDFFHKNLQNIEKVGSLKKKIMWERTNVNNLDIPQYFSEQMISPVHFEDAIKSLSNQGYVNFLEIGTNPILRDIILSISSKFQVAYTLKDNTCTKESLTENFIKLYLMGVDLDWNKISSGKLNGNLPLYEFSKSKFWLPEKKEVKFLNKKNGYSLEIINRAEKEVLFEVNLSAYEQPHLLDHRIFNIQIFAAASWIALAIQIGQAVLGARPIAIHKINFIRPLIFQEIFQEIKMKIKMKKYNNNFLFEFFSEETQTIFCKGELGCYNGNIKDIKDIKDIKLEKYPDFYNKFNEKGYTLGNSFNWIDSGIDEKSKSIKLLCKPDSIIDIDSYPIYPGLIDSCFHALYSLIEKDLVSKNGIVVPSEVESLIYLGSPLTEKNYTVYATALDKKNLKLPDLSAGFSLISPTVGTILDIESIKFSRVSEKFLMNKEDKSNLFIGYEVFNKCDNNYEYVDSFTTSNIISNDLVYLDYNDNIKSVKIIIDNGFFLEDDNVSKIVEICLIVKDFILDEIIPNIKENKELKVYTFIRGSIHPNNTNIVNSAVLGFIQSAIAELPEISLTMFDGEINHPSNFLDSIIYSNNILPGQYLYEDSTLNKIDFKEIDTNYLSNIKNDISSGVTIIIGAGGLLEPILKWLVSINIKDIIVFSRSPLDKVIKNLVDVNIDYIQGNIINKLDVENLFQQVAIKGKNVSGIINLAGILSDQPFSKMDDLSLRKVINPKLQGCLNIEKFMNLDDLSFFLTFTSIGIYYASAMQSNYTAANKAVHSWINKKRKEGFPITSIALGPIQVGMGKSLSDNNIKRLNRLGIDFISLSELNTILNLAKDTLLPIIAYARIKTEDNTICNKSETLENITEIKILDNLLICISKLLGVDISILKPDSSLIELGADSLLAVEVSSWIKSKYSTSVSMENILGANTIKSIAELILCNINKETIESKDIAKWTIGEI